jgi:hypothetical protein
MHPQDLMVAAHAAAALAALLAAVFLVVRGTYLILKLFTEEAGYVTTILVTLFVVIGWLNR